MDWWNEALQPQVIRPDDDVRASVVRSYLVMRMTVGALAVLLPGVLLVGDVLLVRGAVLARPSLSAYYYSGMRDVFVGILVALGCFMVHYHVDRRRLENVLSSLGGLAAISVSLWPTERPEHSLPLTPLQERLGESFVSGVHTASGSTVFATMAVISYLYGRRERARTGHPDQCVSARRWQQFHYGCSAILVASMTVLVVSSATGWWSSHAVWVDEVAGLTAFGGSWFAKGCDLRKLTSRHE